MGPQFVHLPLPGDQEFWPRLHEIAQRRESARFDGVGRPWPNEPLFELDFWQQARSADRVVSPGSQANPRADATSDTPRP
jgi:hypothetical protein